MLAMVEPVTIAMMFGGLGKLVWDKLKEAPGVTLGSFATKQAERIAEAAGDVDMLRGRRASARFKLFGGDEL